MRYFKEIALWKMVVLNTIVGLCMAYPFLIGTIYYFGIFGTAAAVNAKMRGLEIFITIIMIIILANFSLWRLSKRGCIESKEDKKVHSGRLIVTMLTLCLMLNVCIITGALN